MDKGKIMFKLNQLILVVLGFSAAISYVQAGVLTVPNTFSAGTKAVAADVNDNFGAVKNAVDDNDGRITVNAADIASMQAAIAALQATVSAQATTIATLQSDLSSVQGNSVLALDGNLSFITDANGYATALFSGVNVQVINGVDQSTPNGVGNIIVGYNSNGTAPFSACSDGQHTTQITCEMLVRFGREFTKLAHIILSRVNLIVTHKSAEPFLAVVMLSIALTPMLLVDLTMLPVALTVM